MKNLFSDITMIDKSCTEAFMAITNQWSVISHSRTAGVYILPKFSDHVAGKKNHSFIKSLRIINRGGAWTGHFFYLFIYFIHFWIFYFNLFFTKGDGKKETTSKIAIGKGGFQVGDFQYLSCPGGMKFCSLNQGGWGNGLLFTERSIFLLN